MSNFIQDCINGDALMSEIDDYIDRWHESAEDISLHDYLGMTFHEYALFIEDSSYIGLIITAHKNNIDIDTIVTNQIPLAARSKDPSKAERLQRWLDNEGLWK
ncbi:MAG: hypothetical protein IM638_11740 [Bacteroidetes bacterium]|nr:hypothetical protein [Bacteroidota bacterium]